MTLVENWNWWRHNHGYPFWKALHLTLIGSFWWPLRSAYCWLKLRTYWRWDTRQHRKLDEAIKAGDVNHWRIRRLIRRMR